MDELITEFHTGYSNNRETLILIISILRQTLDSNAIDINPLVNDIANYIKLHLTEDISIEKISEKFNLSLYYMCHLFKNITGVTISAYRNQERIKKAKALLISTDENITDIALFCGFSSSCYFTEVFTKLVGISPTEFRVHRENTVYFPFFNWHDQALADILPSLKLLDNISISSIKKDSRVKTWSVSMPDAEYGFLHEAAVIEYHGVLFASWYNNPNRELCGRTPIRGRRSHDGGKTWSDIEIIADDPTGKILYCPPVYGICHDRLYLFMNEMTAPDHIHALNLFVFDENKDCFVKLWSRPIPFKLNTNVYTLPNGKLMLPGRTGELDRFPNTPAVLISDSGQIDAEWRLVKITENGILPDGENLIHPELSAIIYDGTIYMFCRNDNRRVPLIYLSEDNGESWRGPFAYDIPFTNSKLYSGTLSDGRNYVMGNILEGRSKLAIFFSRPGSMRFDTCVLLEDGSSEDFPEATMWHYPVAIESEGMLKTICTVSLQGDIRNAPRGAVLITLPISE